MPLTPFHLGPALLVGLVLFSFLDFPTFIIANVILDIEPILVLFLNLNYPLHGFFHSFLGGTIIALLLAAVMSKIGKYFSPLLSAFKLEQKTSFKNILAASLSGIYIHILLDSRMHADIQPFYPLTVNPLLDTSLSSTIGIYMLCIWSFIVGIAVYAIKLFLSWKKERS